MAAGPEDHPDIQVFNEIRYIEHLVRTAIARRLPVGLTYPQFEVMNHLSRRGDGITPRAIARLEERIHGWAHRAGFGNERDDHHDEQRDTIDDSEQRPYFDQEGIHALGHEFRDAQRQDSEVQNENRIRRFLHCVRARGSERLEIGGKLSQPAVEPARAWLPRYAWPGNVR